MWGFPGPRSERSIVQAAPALPLGCPRRAWGSCRPSGKQSGVSVAGVDEPHRLDGVGCRGGEGSVVPDGGDEGLELVAVGRPGAEVLDGFAVVDRDDESVVILRVDEVDEQC